MTSSGSASRRGRRRDGDDDSSAERCEDIMLTTAQVAQLLHIVPKQVILYVRDGRIRAHRLPGMRQYLFWRQDIMDLIEASVVKPNDADEDVSEPTSAEHR